MGKQRITFTDVIVFAFAMMIVASMTLTQVQQHRAGARRSACAHNLIRLVLAAHNYHSAFKQLPMGCGGTSAAPDSKLWQSNQDRLSAFVGLAPFHGEIPLWQQISNPKQVGEIAFPAMGPAPLFDPKTYAPWSLRPKILVCPADQDATEFSTASSYVVNYGDAVHLVGSPYDPENKALVDAVSASNRGLFFGQHVVKFRDIRDGLSNTLMFSEACIASKKVAKQIDGMSLDPSRCIAAHKDPATQFWPRGREACWADGCLRSTGFQTILPPNSTSATTKNSDIEGVMSASSHHLGGVHAGMADGMVKFIVDSIDAGQSDSPTVALLPGTDHAKPKSQSPYGLWGAIGTRASLEVVKREEECLQVPPLSITENEIEAIKRTTAEVWERSGDGPAIRGKLIAVVDKSLFYWSDEENEVQYMALSKLVSRDAEEVKIQYGRMLDRVILKLKVQITKATKMLNENELSDFCDTMLQSDSLDRKQMESFVEQNKGLLVLTLEDLSRELGDSDSRAISRRSSSDAPITIRMSRMRQLIDDISFIYRDGRWAIRVR